MSTTNFPINSEHVLGSILRPEPTIWIVEIKNGKDNRLTGVVCREFLTPALDMVEKEWRLAKRDGKGEGALIITGNLAQEKFFSNGFDYEEVTSTPGLGFIYNNFVPIVQRLLTYPIPAIAALNGHTFAAGFMLAMACDYRVMSSGKAWACMNEVAFGAPFPRSFAALFQEKARSPTVVRSIALEGHKFTPKELLDLQLVDELADGGSKGVLSSAMALGKKMGKNASTGVWGLIKRELYASTLARIADDGRQVMPFEEDDVMMAKL